MTDVTGLGPCQDSTGVLFSHPCKWEAVLVCSRCQKAICRNHTIPGPDTKPLCSSCGKKRVSRPGADSQRVYRDNPYFYSSYYYHGYGYYGHGYWGHDHYNNHHPDPRDFTEADGANLEAGDEGFEQDMSAS